MIERLIGAAKVTFIILMILIIIGIYWLVSGDPPL